MHNIAWVVAASTLLVVGCSGDGGGGSAKPGPVFVTVQADGAPSAGTDVVFHDDAGEILAHLLTDPSGLISHAEVPHDGLVTALYTAPSGSQTLRTVGGLRSGDQVQFVFGDVSIDPDFATLAITLPGIFSGAAEYEVKTACSSAASGTTSLNLTVQESCLDPNGFVDFLALAVDGNDVPLAYSLAQNVNVGSVADFASPLWETDLTPISIQITGITHPNAIGAFGSAVLTDAGRGIELFEGGTAASGGAATLQGFSIPLFGQTGTLVAALVFDDAGAEVASFRLETVAVPLGNVTYDAVDDLFPPLLGVVLDTTMSATRPTIRWEETSLDGVDLFSAASMWDGGAGPSISWTVSVPANGARDGEFLFPDLPPTLGALIPAVGGEPTILILGSSAADDFDDLKHMAASDFEIGEIEVGTVFHAMQSGDF